MMSILPLAGLVLAAPAQTAGLDVLKSFSDALFKAEGVKAVYTYGPIGGASDTYTIRLAKPNLAFIDGPGRTVIADGKKITFFLKEENVFFRRDQSDSELAKLFSYRETMVWAPFFDKDGFKYVMQAREEGTRTRRGMNLRVVKAEFGTGTNATFYIDAADNLVKQAELTAKVAEKTEARLLDTRSIEMGKLERSAVVSWTPPQGAKEVKEADLMAANWYTDFDEARRVAMQQNKIMLVDFYATNCRFCVMLERNVFSSDAFRNKSRRFVLVKLEASAAPDAHRHFQIEGTPTVKFIRPGDLSVVGEFVGYRELPEVLNIMDGVR